jgi:hypothetical protein
MPSRADELAPSRLRTQHRIGDRSFDEFFSRRGDVTQNQMLIRRNAHPDSLDAFDDTPDCASVSRLIEILYPAARNHHAGVPAIALARFRIPSE